MFPVSQAPESPCVPIVLVDRADWKRRREEGDTFLRHILDSSSFEGSFGQVLVVPNHNGQAHEAWAGTEKWPEDPRAHLFLGAKLAAALPGKLSFSAPAEGWSPTQSEQFSLGWGLASYQFQPYLRKKDKKTFPTLRLDERVRESKILNTLTSVKLGRDLINTPANDLGPAELTQKIKDLGANHGAEVSVIKGRDLLDLNFPAIHAVGKGSKREPALVDLRWGNPDHPKLTLVGKGVVFDTGGLDLKGAAGMRLMKKDMGGAAVTTSLAGLIMSEQLPVRLRLLVPTVENSPGEEAYRPGDIIQTRKGISVEIHNTDAEGRVIMCDALTEAVSESPDLVIDMATLTGACRIALGQDLPGFWTPSDEIAAGLTEAGNEVADPLWRMPLWVPYRKMLQSPIADLSNCASNGMAGAITAALYLHEFVKPNKNWIHMDVYGWRTEAIPGTPKGGEATALRAVFRYLEKRFGTDRG